MSILDNVKAALENQYQYSLLESLTHLGRYGKVEKEMTARAMDLLKVFGLDKEPDLLSSNLPYGQQRKLEIARAMATDPKLLLLDEPAAGMNPNETKELMDTIEEAGFRYLRETDGTQFRTDSGGGRYEDCFIQSGSSQGISGRRIMGALLEVKNLNVYYGVIHALKDVSFHVNKGEVVALIGANGAGKTTTLHTLSGLACCGRRAAVFFIRIRKSRECQDTKLYQWAWRRFPRGDVFLRI